MRDDGRAQLDIVRSDAYFAERMVGAANDAMAAAYRRARATT